MKKPTHEELRQQIQVGAVLLASLQTEVSRLRERCEWLTQAAAGELKGAEFDRISQLADEVFATTNGEFVP